MFPHPQIQPITDHVVLQDLFFEKYQCVCGPTQFKPVLFKDQQYMHTCDIYNNMSES